MLVILCCGAEEGMKTRFVGLQSDRNGLCSDKVPFDPIFVFGPICSFVLDPSGCETNAAKYNKNKHGNPTILPKCSQRCQPYALMGLLFVALCMSYSSTNKDSD